MVFKQNKILSSYKCTIILSLWSTLKQKYFILICKKLLIISALICRYRFSFESVFGANLLRRRAPHPVSKKIGFFSIFKKRFKTKFHTFLNILFSLNVHYITVLKY